MSLSFRTIAVSGGTGALGYLISEAFLSDGSYKVKILRKKPADKNEKADLLASKGAEIVYVDYNDKNDLVKALEGTDVVVSAVSGDFYTIQSPLLAAAKEAGVKRFIPSEFGCDQVAIKAAGGEVHPILVGKGKLQAEIEKSGLEYTYIYTGLFQEYIGLFGFDIKNKKATFYADGDTKISSTALSDIVRYTVESLKIPEARNASINVSGATLTLNEWLQKFEEATGSKWEVFEDKEVRHRFRTNTDPVPTIFDDFKVFAIVNTEFKNVDNSKFSFTPRPVTEVIKTLLK